MKLQGQYLHLCSLIFSCIALIACTNTLNEKSTNKINDIAVVSAAYIVDTVIVNKKDTTNKDSVVADVLTDASMFKWDLVNDSYYENMVRPCTFQDSIKLFALPDTNAEVLGYTEIGKPLSVLRKSNNGYGIIYWYEINWRNKIAYVKAEDVASHCFRSYSKGGNKYDSYLVLARISKYNPNGGLIIYKYDQETKKYIDTLNLEDKGGDVINRIPQLEEKNGGWKNVNLFIHAKRIRAYCGGGVDDVYIVDANGKLKELISTKSYADDGGPDSYSSSVWFPIKFNNGNELLVSEGDLEGVFNANSGELDTISFPKNLSVPNSELVVYNEFEVVGEYDENDTPKEDSDGYYIENVILDSTYYMHWNGEKLVPIK